MDGVFLYWIGWMSWIVVHFFWEDDLKRYRASLSILMFLSFIPLSFHVGNVTFSLMFFPFILLLCSFIRHYPFRKLLYYILLAVTVGAAYAAFQLMFIFDPVIAFVDEKIISALIVTLIAASLQKTLVLRYHLALFGLLQGEIIASLAKNEFMYVPYFFGSLAFFDKVAIVTLFYGMWAILYYFISKGRNVAMRKYFLQKSS